MGLPGGGPSGRDFCSNLQWSSHESNERADLIALAFTYKLQVCLSLTNPHSDPTDHKIYHTKFASFKTTFTTYPSPHRLTCGTPHVNALDFEQFLTFNLRTTSNPLDVECVVLFLPHTYSSLKLSGVWGIMRTPDACPPRRKG